MRHTGPVVIADWGGDVVALDCAELLASEGADVTLVTSGYVAGDTRGRPSAIPPARPRWGLRGRVLEPGERAWGSATLDGSSITLAESVRGTAHRHAPPRVPRPRRRAERTPSTSPAEPIPYLLSPRQNTPLAGQGRAGAKDGSSALTTAGSSRRPWSAASIIVTRARRRKIRPACGGLPAPRSGSGRSQRRLPRSFSASALNHHTEHLGPRGVSFRSQAVLLTNGRSRSSDTLDALNGRDTHLSLAKDVPEPRDGLERPERRPDRRDAQFAGGPHHRYSRPSGSKPPVCGLFRPR